MESVKYLWVKLEKLCTTVLGSLGDFVEEMMEIVTKEVVISGEAYSILEVMLGGLVGLYITKQLVKWGLGL